jgi:hypothetical protein
MGRLLAAFAMGLALATGACSEETSAGGKPAGYPANPANPPIDGLLIEGGVECPAMQGPDGTLYTLLGDIGGYEVGDKICVVPGYVEVSFCMQGTTIHVDWIGPAPCPAE